MNFLSHILFLGSHSATSEERALFDTTTKSHQELLEKAITDFVNSPTTNLVHIRDTVCEIESQIEEICREIEKANKGYYGLEERIATLRSSFEARLTPYVTLLHEKKNELFFQQKWLEFQLPVESLATDPDCVEFLMKSRFAHFMTVFKNSTLRGIESDGMVKIENDKTVIKINGEYKAWEEIRKIMYHDEKQDRVSSRIDSSISYSCISPDGIVQKSPQPEELYPVDALSHEEHVKLMQQAKRFWETNPEVDPGQEKECIFQIVTSQKDILPRNWLTQNVNDIYPSHNFVRLIDKEGKVYSFGSRATKETVDFVFADSSNFLATGYTKIDVPDYDEPRSFDKRRVTSVPLTEERMNEIIQVSNEINKSDGVRFCFSKQNCNTFVVHLASLAGIEIDTWMSLAEVLSECLPSVKQIPIVGGVLSLVAERVSALTTPIFTAIANYTPDPIKYVFSVIREAITFIPLKIRTVIFNYLILIYGGDKQAEPMKNKRPSDERYQEFPQLIQSKEDFFVESTSDSRNSWRLVQWQQKQHSTRSYGFDGTLKMYML